MPKSQKARAIVFVGANELTLDIHEIKEDSRFNAAFCLSRIDKLQGRYKPPFSYVQAFCVSYKPLGYSWPGDIFVFRRAVRWLLCFPVNVQDDEVRGQQYVLQTNAISPDAFGVFFFFTGVAPEWAPIRAVPCLNSLNFLSPSAESKLALVRASRWRQNWGWNTALIRPKDVIGVEIIQDSRVRIF